MKRLFLIILLTYLMIGLLSAEELVTLSGRVLGSDTELAIAEALVLLAGHSSALTDEEGLFTITDVNAEQTYTLIIRAKNYVELVLSITIAQTDLDVGDLMIYEMTYPPRNVSVKTTENHAHITWQQPIFPDFEELVFTHAISDSMGAFTGCACTALHEFELAHRFTQGQLVQFGVSGGELSSVIFLMGDPHKFYPAVLTPITINIYAGGTSDPYLDSGDLIYTQNAGYQLGVWCEVELTTPVSIPTEGELWIAIEVNPHYEIPLDSGPALNGFGNLSRVLWGNHINSWIAGYYGNDTNNWLIKGRAIIDGDDVILASRAFETYNIYRTLHENLDNEELWTLIASGISETEYFDTSWTTADYGNYRYIVKAVYTNDNLSSGAISNVAVKLPAGQVLIGDPTLNQFAWNNPFSFFNNSSLSQNIYRAEDITLTGYINEIEYTFQSNGTINEPKPIAVYMANIERGYELDWGDDWIAFEEFTLVYDGLLAVDLPAGIHNIPIILDTSFEYTGDDLVLYTWRKYDDIYWESSFNAFQSTGYMSNISAKSVGSNEPIELNPEFPPSYGAFVSNRGPVIKLTFDLFDGEIFYPPQNLDGSAEGEVVTLVWEAPIVTTVLGYEIYRDGVLFAETTELIFIDESVEYENVYTYGVKSVYQKGSSDAEEITITVLYFAPPVNLQATDENGKIYLRWQSPQTLNLTENQGYRIYRDDELLSETLRSTDTSFIDENIVQSVEYTYYVKAVWTDGISEASNSVTIKSVTLSEEPPPLLTELHGNFPNPFNPETIIRFSLAEAGVVSLKIYNVKGQLVTHLLNKELEIGNHQVVWDGTDENGRMMSSGLYFYRMQTNTMDAVKRMVMLK